MKTALVTTTINVPVVLKLYRELGPDVKFFIALDRNSDFTGVAQYPTDLLASWLTPQFQEQWKCSELIGWNCIQRRNLATLEALKWGAEVIVSIDDDNIPFDCYFDHIDHAFADPYNGLVASNGSHVGNWFDVGRLLSPAAKHRGIPFEENTLPRFAPITGARIGVVAGVCLGDPDCDAITRLAGQPDVHHTSELLRNGIVVERQTFTVFNSQNTAFLRELAPAMFMIPHVGRYDDIFASIICRRAMSDRKLYTHFGQPFVWQQRNPHKLMRDLKDEILGMEHVDEFARYVDRFPHPSDPLIPFLRELYDDLQHNGWWPQQASWAAFAWLDDCEQVM